jgi:alkylhydroperoxidase family enzyme
MARLPYLNHSDLAPENQDLLKRPINLFRVMTHSPGGARVFHALGEYIRWNSPLDTRLRELAIIQVGYITRSVYEYTHHIKIGLDFGVTHDDLIGLASYSAGKSNSLDDLTKGVLDAATEMTNGHEMSDKTWNNLILKMSPEHLTDLVIIISFYNCVVRFISTMKIDNEPEFQAFLIRYPFATL